MDCDILILGNGCAAQSAIAAVRRQDPNRKITVVSDILWPSYNPMLTTYYLSGKAELEPLLRQQMPEGRSACDGITRYAGSPVQRLDAVNQQVQLADGTCLQYRDCLVATGAAPLIPKMEGAELDHVFTMRTLDDVVSLKGFLSRKRVRRAVVAGASMVGIKVAEFFLRAGISCCLADAAPHVFPLAASPHCALRLEELIRDQGMTLQLGRAVSAVTPTEVCFADGTVETADVVVLALGVRPRLAFVDREQVPVDRGILVDTRMRTRVPHLFAAGDCAQDPGPSGDGKQIVGLLINARMQGETAGINLAGGDLTYSGTIPHNITHFLDIDFVGVGDPLAQGQVLQWEERQGGRLRYLRLVRQGERLLQANLINCESLAGILKTCITRWGDHQSSASDPRMSFSEYAMACVKRELPAAVRTWDI